MAGLQQYNFFPTDLLYPRPQLSSSSSSSIEPASVKPSTLPLKNPNLEISQDLRQQQQPKKKMPQHPSKHALFYNRKKKQSKYSINPLSLVVFVEDDDESGNN